MGYSLWGCKESDTTKQLSTCAHTRTHTHPHTHTHRHLVSATHIFVVIPGTSKFIKCKYLLVLLWESVGQGASIIIIFAVFIYLFIHSFNNPNPSNDQGWAKSSEDPEIWGWGLPAWLKGRNPPASKGSLACKDWRMTHSSGLLPGRHGNPVRPDLLIFKENLKT